MSFDGGKNGEGVWHRIINQQPPHGVYIECFLGSAAVLERKKPARLNFGIEINPSTVAAARSKMSARTSALEILEGDALKWLRQFDCCADTLIYADPPYLRSVRSCKRDLFEYEFATPAEHRRLLRFLNSLKAMVQISGYWSELYARELVQPKWRFIKFNAMSRRGLREEVLWMNYPDPVALHDYSYLGEDRTERQRIKRKKARWLSRLSKMSALERNALLDILKAFPATVASADGADYWRRPAEPVLTARPAMRSRPAQPKTAAAAEVRP